MMRRRGLVAMFAAMAVAAAGDAVALVVDATHDATTRAWLDAGYGVLKAGVVVLFAVFVARRDPARRRTHRPTAFIACMAAIVCVLVLERPDAATATALVVAGECLAVAAGVWMFAATLALGRCFGVLPEARGLVTRGPYRLVRHPLYLGELGACAGLVVASPSARNVVIAAVFVIAQAARMRMEERELALQFADYPAYAARTPRLVPRPRWARLRPAAPVPAIGQGEAA